MSKKGYWPGGEPLPVEERYRVVCVESDDPLFGQDGFRSPDRL